MLFLGLLLFAAAVLQVLLWYAVWKADRRKK